MSDTLQHTTLDGNPRRVARGEPPLILDARDIKTPVTDYLNYETRSRMVERMDPARFKKFTDQTQRPAQQRMAVYKHMATLRLDGAEGSIIETDDNGEVRGSYAECAKAAKGGA